MKKILIYYNFIIVSIIVITGFVSAQNVAHLVSASVFFPVFIYFSRLVIPSSRKAINIQTEKPVTVPGGKIAGKPKSEPKVEDLVRIKDDEEKFDVDRRAFIKLAGSAGATVLFMSVFGVKKAQAAFFGSVPGPGIVGIKDSTGALIDPAEKHPTDGYNISELDDSVPAYYGFTNKDGAWFIMQESSGGAYRYSKGTSSFSTNWTSRAVLSYDYFENVF